MTWSSQDSKTTRYSPTNLLQSTFVSRNMLPLPELVRCQSNLEKGRDRLFPSSSLGLGPAAN